MQNRPLTLSCPATAADNNCATAQSVRARPSESPAQVQSSILVSWKEIASFMGRGVRTVQRWEHYLAMPVHRPKGKDRSSVLAFPEELNQWLHRTPVKHLMNGENGDPQAVELFGLARDLLVQGERLMNLVPQRRAEVGKIVFSLREIVGRLSIQVETAELEDVSLTAEVQSESQPRAWPRTKQQKRA